MQWGGNVVWSEIFKTAPHAKVLLGGSYSRYSMAQRITWAVEFTASNGLSAAILHEMLTVSACPDRKKEEVWSLLFSLRTSD